MFHSKAALIAFLFLLLFTYTASAADARPNVLFIAVDDLRPQIACYGERAMHTPSLDRLARQGVLFERAFCMVPTCGASRASLLTGIRPTRQRFVNYLAWAERDAPGVLTLNSHFKNSGYTTISLGKVFHHPADYRDGWSERPWRSKKTQYHDVESLEAAIALNKLSWPEKSQHRGPPFENFDAPDEEYPDGDCAAKAIEYLKEFSAAVDKPFFLAVGFLKPHLPFNAPKKYWDMYDAATIDLPDNYFPPQDVPPRAVHDSGELRAYAGIPARGPVDRETARQLIHGYYACVSFTDTQIGKVLDALERFGLAKNTIIVLWGDHGWQLGEHGMWNKHSCFETSMHAPLIIVTPNDSKVAPGKRVAALAEFLDIYPTLCELTGLPVPSHLEGTSLVQLMRDPSHPGKPYAIGRFGNGDTIRSDTLRFTEYATRTGRPIGTMLYDHTSDPDENVNIAKQRSAESAELAAELRNRMGK